MKLAIPYRYLKALSSFASANERRPVINSVLLEIASNRVILVATDGRLLGLISMPCEIAIVAPGNHSGRKQFVIPSELIERACPYDAQGVCFVSIAGNRVSISTTSEERGSTAFSTLIEGQFPDWRSVFHPYKLAPLGDTVVNPVFVECFGAIGVVLHPGHGSAGMTIARLKESGDLKPTQTALVFRFTHAPEFVGLLMPLNSDSLKNEVEAIRGLPSWIEPTEPRQEVKGDAARQETERWGDRVWIVPPGARIFHLKRQKWIDAPGIGEPSGRGILYRVPVGVERDASIVPLPENEHRTNGKSRCDALRGPCRCGAWHVEGGAK